MNLLALDIGSSSVKSAMLRDGKIVGRIVRSAFPTRFEGVRVEVEAQAVLKAVAAAIRQFGSIAKKADAIGLTVMAPSWVAMNARGDAITPIITHQDRRSVEIARELEQKIGKDRHLQLAGNRPFPGGMSSTTWAWYLKHSPATLKKADLVGHLNTFLHRQMTGARVTDPSNASFMGLYSTLTLAGWNDELCQAVGASPRLLPEIREANQIGGRITAEAARRFGLTAGTPMMVGLMDGSAAMLLAGARVGQLVNTAGSTDVLGLCTDRPHPHEKLLTRALGIGRLWMSVSTIAAAGSSLAWAKDQLFADLSIEDFRKLTTRLAARPLDSTVRFEPYLAGERTSIEQRQGAFTGLTLSTTRQEMLSAVIESLAAASAARLPLLSQGGVKMLRKVTVTGGMQGGLDKVLHRDWPGKWTFKPEEEATLRGLGTMAIRER
jgi:xylulokinase